MPVLWQIGRFDTGEIVYSYRGFSTDRYQIENIPDYENVTSYNFYSIDDYVDGPPILQVNLPALGGGDFGADYFWDTSDTELFDNLNNVCMSSYYSRELPGVWIGLEACQASLTGGEDVNFSTISAQVFTGNCDSNGNPIYNHQNVQVIQGTEDGELLKYQKLSEIQGHQTCNIDVAACPDGWLIRPEYHRPQVIYQFAQIDDSGNIVGAPKYKITVPHHVSTKPTDALPDYQRGNWEIIYVLKDNSKVTIHSLDEENGMTVLDEIKSRINSAYLTDAYLSKSSLVVGANEIAQIEVTNRMAKYYSQGTKSELPDWIVKW